VVRLLVALFVGLGLLAGQFGTPVVVAQNATPVSGSPVADCPTTGAEENEATARRWHEDALGAGAMSVFNDILAPDFTHDSATFENPADLESLRARWRHPLCSGRVERSRSLYR